ncbi:MAG: alkaline phosphatase family protein [Gemmatimonadales bacterium]|nr:alkaline phosphatase family protein [Gemmatimonadales bacterium]
MTTSRVDRVSTPRCLLILVDGLRPDVAEREAAAGRLPNLARLTDRGGRGRAITAFPSTTSVAYLPFLTGCLPGRCNVPSIRWLDRAAYAGRWWRERDAVRSYCGYQAGMLDADIAPDIRTIFQLVPESAAFFTMITRGLTPERDPTQGARKFWGALSHYLLWHQPADGVVAKGLLDWIERDPDWRFLFAQFPAVDGYTHQTTPDAPKVVRALHRVDAAVGDTLALLEAKGQRDNTLILLVSDHGATTVREHLDLATWFRSRGIPTLAHPELWRPDPRVAVMVAGNGSAMLYAAPGVPRTERWPLARLRTREAFGAAEDLVSALVREPAVAFVAAEDHPGQVRLLDAQGEAIIADHGDRISYRPEGSDPLGTGPFEADRRDTLARSFHETYPDAAVQLLDQFRSPRTGDLVVIGREGYDFRDRWEIPEHKAGHGSLFRAHMQVPLWSSQPLGAVPLRTVDIFATMLDWLNVEAPSGIDAELVWRAGAPQQELVPALVS